MMNLEKIWGEEWHLNNRLHHILLPESPYVQQLNHQFFRLHTHYWLKRYHFMPVIRYIENDTLYIKIYYLKQLEENLSYTEELASALYMNYIKDRTFYYINFLKIAYEHPVPITFRCSVSSHKEAELMILSGMKPNDSVFCNLQGEGSFYGRGYGWKKECFYYYSNIIEQEYNTRFYGLRYDDTDTPNEACRYTQMHPQPESPERMPADYSDKDPKLLQLKKEYLSAFYIKEMALPDASNICGCNAYFSNIYGNMLLHTKGILAEYKAYQDKKIQFQIIVDSRYDGDPFKLCEWMTHKYCSVFPFLQKIKGFEATLYQTEEPISFLYNPLLGHHVFIDQLIAAKKVRRELKTKTSFHYCKSFYRLGG